jgi:phosphopantetheinyl transferase (holo-ACP synthase)
MTALLLTLLEVSNEVQNDEDGSDLLARIERGDILSHVVDAGSLTTGGHSYGLSSPPSDCEGTTNDDDGDDVYGYLSRHRDHEGRSSRAATRPSPLEAQPLQRQVTKYLQTKDKYMSLASILLKSRAFYQYRSSLRGEINDTPSSSTGGLSQSAQPESQIASIRPIVDLPRTQHNKPYIPIQQNQDETNKCNIQKHGSAATDTTKIFTMEEAVFPLSISHQFPYIGIATKTTSKSSKGPSGAYNDKEGRRHHLRQKQQQEKEGSFSRSCLIEEEISASVLIGLDIVVFEELNRRLYSTVDEFLDVFFDSLTSREWNRIQSIKNYRDDDDDDKASDNSSRLTDVVNELYVTWAMKEAYTKALGVGLGFNFGQVDIVLHFTDYCCVDEEKVTDGISYTDPNQPDNRLDDHRNLSSPSYWKAIKERFPNMSQSKNYVHVPGHVGIVHNDGSLSDDTELWHFFFVALNTATSTTTVSGCACVCAGPYPSQQTHGSDVDLIINRTALESLIDFHNYERNSYS